MCNRDPNPYSLKAACKDCPFRKESTYLNETRMKNIISYMSNEDRLFPCHKTANREARNNYEEALAEIEDMLKDAHNEDERLALKKQLEGEYDLIELEKQVLNAMHNEEKICAGWLILGKKEGIIFNNFPLRLAAMNKQLSLDQFKDEDAVFDSVDEAIKAHS